MQANQFSLAGWLADWLADAGQVKVVAGGSGKAGKHAGGRRLMWTTVYVVLHNRKVFLANRCTYGTREKEGKKEREREREKEKKRERHTHNKAFFTLMMRERK
jgi:hypothetical protein